MPVPVTNAAGAFTEAVGGAAVNPTVAAAGSVIANAAALSLGFTIVTGADDAKGVILPVAYPGATCEIYSNAATAGLKVYPQVNSQINDGTANSAIVLEGRFLARFRGTSGSNWAAAFTVNA